MRERKRKGERGEKGGKRRVKNCGNTVATIRMSFI